METKSMLSIVPLNEFQVGSKNIFAYIMLLSCQQGLSILNLELFPLTVKVKGLGGHKGHSKNKKKPHCWSINCQLPM